MAAQNDSAPAHRFRAQLTSPLINGEAELTVTEQGLTVSTTFDTVVLAFIDINAVALTNFEITVQAVDGEFRISRLGSSCQWFFDALCDAFSAAVLQASFIEGDPLVVASGEYSLIEDGMIAHGTGSFRVYEDSVLILPPNLDARRIPLCFVTALDKGDFQLSLRLDTNESYTLARLGFATEPFAQAVEVQIRSLREKSALAVQGIDPSLTAAQSSQLAKLMMRGVATPLGVLNQVAPGFVTAVEALIATGPAAETYAVLKDLCDPELIHIGFFDAEDSKELGAETGRPAFDLKSGKDSLFAGGMNVAAVLDGGLLQGNESSPEASVVDNLFSVATTSTSDSNNPTIWFIAPSPNKRFATVEFAENNCATFVYKTDGDFAACVSKLNHALEAINFRREVIRLTDEELQQPQYQHYCMSIKRIEPLRFVRSRFAGRVIHSSPETWQRKLLELWA